VGVREQQRRLPCRIALAALIGLTVLVGVVAATIVHTQQSLVIEAFRERGLAYGRAFADSVESWIVRDQNGMVATGARLLKVAGIAYVRVVHAGTVLYEEETAPRVGSVTLTPDGAITDASARIVVLPGGAHTLDTVVPLRGIWDPSIDGHVRLGIDASAPIARAAAIAWIVSGAAAALLAVAWGTGAALVLRRRLPLMQPADHRRPTPPIAGSFVIDERRKLVRYHGRPLRLTPKQFALLRLLASDPDAVFSDEEILAAVWPESTYADGKDVKQCVYLLRRRLAKLGAPSGEIIVNVPGFGYRIGVPGDDDLDVT